MRPGSYPGLSATAGQCSSRERAGASACRSAGVGESASPEPARRLPSLSLHPKGLLGACARLRMCVSAGVRRCTGARVHGCGPSWQIGLAANHGGSPSQSQSPPPTEPRFPCFLPPSTQPLHHPLLDSSALNCINIHNCPSYFFQFENFSSGNPQPRCRAIPRGPSRVCHLSLYVSVT